MIGDKYGDYTCIEVAGAQSLLECKCGALQWYYTTVLAPPYLNPQSCIKCLGAKRRGIVRGPSTAAKDYHLYAPGMKFGSHEVITDRKLANGHYCVDLQCKCGAVVSNYSISRLRRGKRPKCRTCVELYSAASKRRIPKTKDRLCECGRIIMNADMAWCAYCERRHGDGKR